MSTRARPSRLRWGVLGLCLLLLGAAFGLKAWSPRGERKLPAPAPSAALAPRSVPPGLVARLRISAPSEVFERLLAAPGLSLLPRLPLALGAVLGVGPAAAGEIDDRKPAHGLLYQTDRKTLALAVAVGLRSGSAFVATATTGNTGFRSMRDASGFVSIERENGEANVAFGVFGNHLVFGSPAGSLGTVAPYLVRDVPAQRWPAAEICGVAEPAGLALLSSWLETKLAKALRVLRTSAEETERAMGRPPELGDPAAVLVSLERRLLPPARALGEAREAVFSVLPRSDSWRFELRFVPTPGSDADDLRRGLTRSALSTLGDLPRNSELAFAWDAPLERRRAWSKDILQSVSGVLGSRLSARDAARLERALASWDQARGDEAAWGWQPAPGGGVVGVTSMSRSAKPSQLLGELVSALKAPLRAGPLGAHVGDLTFHPAPFDPRGAPGFHTRRAAEFHAGGAAGFHAGGALGVHAGGGVPGRSPAAAAHAPGASARKLDTRRIGVLFRAVDAPEPQQTRLELAFGERPNELFRQWVFAPEATLGRDARLAGAASELGPAEAVLFVHERVLSRATGRTVSGPALAAFGADAEALYLRWSAGAEVLSALLSSGVQ